MRKLTLGVDGEGRSCVVDVADLTPAPVPGAHGVNVARVHATVGEPAAAATARAGSSWSTRRSSRDCSAGSSSSIRRPDPAQGPTTSTTIHHSDALDLVFVHEGSGDLMLQDGPAPGGRRRLHRDARRRPRDADRTRRHPARRRHDRHAAAGRGMNIGGIVIEPVLDGRILSKLHGTRPFPPADSPLMADQDGMVHPDGLVESTLGGFLVRSADRVVLVDAGGGQPIPGGYAPPDDRLRRSG